MRFFDCPNCKYLQYQRFKCVIEQFNLTTFQAFNTCPMVKLLFDEFSIPESLTFRVWDDLSHWSKDYVVMHISCDKNINSLSQLQIWKVISTELHLIEETANIRFEKISLIHSNNNTYIWCIEFKNRVFPDTFASQHASLIKKINAPFFTV